MIRDADNPVARLRIITNTQKAADFLLERAHSIIGTDIDIEVLDGAMVFCPSQVPLPIQADTLIAAAEARWPDQTKIHLPTESDNSTSVEVFGEEPAPFLIDLFEGNMLIGVDGTPGQNVLVAAWLRSVMPEEAPRIIVTDDCLSTHAELPFGVTAEQVAATMVDHGVPGWDADDPDWLQL